MIPSITHDPSTMLSSLRPGARHPLHDDSRDWPATNCHVDLWVVFLHALGLEPLAGLGSTLALDFLGDQWTFVKYSLDDIQALYGINVTELIVWRTLLQHAEQHVAMGQPLIADVDAWFLPDTAGITYRVAHDKTSIGILAIDRATRTLEYVHNSGFFTLEGDDFDALFPAWRSEERLAPYVEVVRLDQIIRRPARELARDALRSAQAHFRRRPRVNPVQRFAERLDDDAAWLCDQGIDAFHQYAFVFLRQCGAGFATAAAFLAWLAESPVEVDAPLLVRAAANYETIARSAKAVQFALARAVARKRKGHFRASLEVMATAWDAATADLAVALTT